LVDGAVFESVDVVAKELEGDSAGDDGGVEWAGGNGDVVIDDSDGLGVSCGDDAEDTGVAGLALGDVSEGFLFTGAIVAEGEDFGVGVGKEGIASGGEFLAMATEVSTAMPVES